MSRRPNTNREGSPGWVVLCIGDGRPTCPSIPRPITRFKVPGASSLPCLGMAPNLDLSLPHVTHYFSLPQRPHLPCTFYQGATNPRFGTILNATNSLTPGRRHRLSDITVLPESGNPAGNRLAVQPRRYPLYPQGKAHCP